MMRDRLYVDGIDIYLEYGVYVPDNDWASLVAYPSLKTPDQNDWQEEDGIEVDLSAPVLDTREVRLSFLLNDVYGSFSDFLALVSDGAFHTFDVVTIQRTFKLRLVSQGKIECSDIFRRETLVFADDYPLDGYTYVAPQSGLPSSDAYAVDDIPTTDYGMRVLAGTLAEVVKTPAVKTGLLRNINTQAGAIYDSGAQVFFKSKDVKLNCLFRAESLPELWRNYYAFLHDLIKPGERLLYVKDYEQELPFYYRSCSVKEFFPEGRIWIGITITIRLTRDFRIDDGAIIASEDRIIIVTEGRTEDELISLRKVRT